MQLYALYVIHASKPDLRQKKKKNITAARNLSLTLYSMYPPTGDTNVLTTFSY